MNRRRCLFMWYYTAVVSIVCRTSEATKWTVAVSLWPRIVDVSRTIASRTQSAVIHFIDKCPIGWEFGALSVLERRLFHSLSLRFTTWRLPAVDWRGRVFNINGAVISKSIVSDSGHTNETVSNSVRAHRQWSNCSQFLGASHF